MVPKNKGLAAAPALGTGSLRPLHDQHGVGCARGRQVSSHVEQRLGACEQGGKGVG